MEYDYLYSTHSDTTGKVGAVIQKAVQDLSRPSDIELSMMPVSRGPLPSVEVVRDIVDLVKTVVFPEFLDRLRGTRAMLEARLSVSTEKLFRMLSK